MQKRFIVIILKNTYMIKARSMIETLKGDNAVIHISLLIHINLLLNFKRFSMEEISHSMFLNLLERLMFSHL